MAEDNSRVERATLVALSDVKDLSPEDRAKHVFNLLKEKAPELTEWDLICFSANYLGMISSAFPWLTLPAKHICQLVYTAHYQDKETDIGTGIGNRKYGINIEKEERVSKELDRLNVEGNEVE